MYTHENYKTKKALKDAVANGNVYDNSVFANGKPVNGNISLEGPHYPAPHTWYAQAYVEDNVIVNVK